MQVLLQVNVAVDFLKDPVLEILQFEKFNNRKFSSENQDSLVHANQDPCGDLLKWLLPLDNTLPPPTCALSPPLSSGSGIGNTSQRSTPASSGSQLFSFGHFRSYSMSALPQNTTSAPPPIANPSTKPNFELEDWDRFSPQKFVKSEKTGSEELLSFRGVSLEPERFSVCYCNTDDLLCVQIKNVSPAHIPDIVVYLDAITVVFEEASVGGSPRSLPMACIEAGNDHCCQI
ncbi:hypothetical protein CK203_025443 [Vitis vinifera]|uniref:Uncharacterized protein n=1 Tax=Vitis vinifera TaxID=29760 RepID=A0A438IZA1_VITVI|nr:hypothetical protein CK203_025443 [Vitis vinifera]